MSPKSHKSVLEECRDKSFQQEHPAIPDKVTEECPTRGSLKSVSQERPKECLGSILTSLSQKSVLTNMSNTIYFRRVFHKNVSEECLAKRSKNSIPQECLRNMFHKTFENVCMDTECHGRVPK